VSGGSEQGSRVRFQRSKVKNLDGPRATCAKAAKMWGHMAGIGVDWCEIGCEVMDELDEMSAPERLDAPLSNISAASHNISTEDVDYWRGDWSTGYDDSSVPLSPLSGPRLGHAGVSTYHAP
jgi:hypothetical protein